MAIIHNTLNDIKQYIYNNNRADDRDKEKALHALSLLTCPQIIENTAMQAVVGFDGSNVPLFWDMTEGNLLATCWTGLGMNYMGCATVLVSLLLRFPKEEFQYYLFTDDFAPHYLRKNGHCAGSTSAMFEGEEDCFRSLEKLFDELNYRNALSETALKKQPFLLVVFGNMCRFRGDKEIERFRAMFSLLFRQGKRLRAACMVATTRFEYEFLYHDYKETFSCFIVGRTDQDTAKQLLKSDIPGWLFDDRNSYRKYFIFWNEGKQVQMQTYHLTFGIALW